MYASASSLKMLMVELVSLPKSLQRRKQQRLRLEDHASSRFMLTKKSFSKSFGILWSSTNKNRSCLTWKLKKNRKIIKYRFWVHSSFSTSISKYINILGRLVQRWPHPESPKNGPFDNGTSPEACQALQPNALRCPSKGRPRCQHVEEMGWKRRWGHGEMASKREAYGETGEMSHWIFIHF